MRAPTCTTLEPHVAPSVRSVTENPGGRANGPGLGRLVGVDVKQSTDNPPTAATPRSWAYCAWHRRMSDTARLVQIHDEGSGSNPPGLFACASCREVHDLVPIADRP